MEAAPTKEGPGGGLTKVVPGADEELSQPEIGVQRMETVLAANISGTLQTDDSWGGTLQQGKAWSPQLE